MLLTGTRDDWLRAFAFELYGPMPPAPQTLSVVREKLPDPHAERLRLDIDGFTVDACLWLPPRPRGIVIGLDFLGPIGTLLSEAYPLDPTPWATLPGWAGGGHGKLDDGFRGNTMHRFPVEMILGAGWGLITSAYYSWVPDHPDHWRETGLVPLLGDGTRALSLWAWALSRLVDTAIELGHTRIALAGHSRLGKAALWAAANDTRVSAVLSNDSGCGGASLESHPGGETLKDMRERFPHWLLEERRMTVDQHQLLAAIAPRGLYVASAAADAWADPMGEYLALRAAGQAWNIALPEPDLVPGAGLVRGPIGWHLRPGGHEILPYDWRRYLAFLNGLFP